MWTVLKETFCLFVFVLLFSTTEIHCKRGGSSGTVSRGRGGGIFSSIKNTFSGHRIGGMQRPGGQMGHGLGGGRIGTGYRPPPSRGIFGGQRYGGGGLLGGRRGWSSGAGRSSYASSRNRAIVSGALGSLAGAYVGYKVGQAMHRPWNMYNGRQYWYGSRHYHPTMGRKSCIFELDDSTPNWDVRYESDNTKVRELVFECNSYEYCCEMACCRAPSRPGGAFSSYGTGWRWWHTLLALFVLGAILAMCLGAAGKMSQRRYAEQNAVLSIYDEGSSKPLNQPGYFDASQQSQPFHMTSGGAAYLSQPNAPGFVYTSAPPVYR